METFVRWLRNGGGLKRLSKYRSKFVNDLAELRIEESGPKKKESKQTRGACLEK